MEDRSLPELVTTLWGIDGFHEKLESLLNSQNGGTLEFEHTSTKAPRTLLIKARALSTDGSRVLLLMMEDITLRREAELLVSRQKKALEGEVATAAHELRRTQDELRGLTAHLFTVQEEERQHVARELHDDVSQRLSALDIMLQGITEQKGAPERLEGFEEVRNQLRALNNDVRLMSHRLHPAILNELGLSAALKSMVKEEALRNVAKHAGKTHVKVVLSGEQGHLQLKVMDFGVGFDQDAEPLAQGLGMISIQERARLARGTFRVQSALGQGTTVTVEVPLESHA